jgi:hypothetical protein
MKQILKITERLLPHIALILAVMFITFLILDQFNPMMNFVNNEFSMKLLWIWCIFTVMQSILIVMKNNK